MMLARDGVHMGCRVSLREAYAPFGQPLDVGRFIQPRRTVERRVAPAQVVGQDEEEIWGPVILGRGRRPWRTVGSLPQAIAASQ